MIGDNEPNGGPDIRVIKSYVWDKETCYCVSTINRRFETCQGYTRGYETLLWKHNWETGTHIGHALYQGDGIADHLQVCEKILQGKLPWESEESDS